MDGPAPSPTLDSQTARSCARVRDFLKGSSEPMKAADIAKKVLDSGYKTKSKVFHLIVGQRLAEMKDVKKPGRGLYSLA